MRTSERLRASHYLKVAQTKWLLCTKMYTALLPSPLIRNLLVNAGLACAIIIGE